MPYKHGVDGGMGDSVIQQVISAGSVPVYFGTAPIHLVRGYKETGLVNTPIKIRSLVDAQKKLGYAYDFDKYTLCEPMAAHFDNGSNSIGPVYMINVLDPDVHRVDGETETNITLVNRRAEISGTDIILDSVVIPRVAPEGDIQEFIVRPNGIAGENKNFNYSQAYAAAGVALKDGEITYTPAGEIAPELINGDYAFIGIQFTKPAGATKATIKINDVVDAEDIDLAKESDNVYKGNLIEYFAFAKADGTPLATNHWNIEVTWTTPDGEVVKECGIGRDGGANYIEGTDYSITYNYARSVVIIEDLTGDMPRNLTVKYATVDASQVTYFDIVGEETIDGQYKGIAALKLLFMETGDVADYLAAPGWSHIPAVYKALAKAARQMNGHWDAFFVADLPLFDEKAIDTIDKAVDWKNDNQYTDERSKICWPMAKKADGTLFHVSTLAVCEMVRLDAEHNGIPYETPSNKKVDIQGQYFGEGVTHKGFDNTDANELNKEGILTIAPWAGYWTLWGPETAAYQYDNLSDLDVRVIFDTNIRMLLYIIKSFQMRWATYIDQPMTRQLKDTIVAREQEFLDMLVTQGALIGNPRVAFATDDDTFAEVLQGNFKWYIEVTATPPLKSATVTVAYTDEGFSIYFDEEV